MNTQAGIDYGLGQTNIDKANGIRYGVISQHSVGQAWYEDAEADYGPPHCPKCGNEADSPESFGETFADGRPDDYTNERYETDDYVCVNCKHFFGGESAFGDEPIGYSYDRDGYKLTDCLDSDIFVLASPYYTFAPFCSPCVPGAGNLDDAADRQDESGVKTYCLGHDWFEDGEAPYAVYSVADDSLVLADARDNG